jgi:hypothetical protein
VLIVKIKAIIMMLHKLEMKLSERVSRGKEMIDVWREPAVVLEEYHQYLYRRLVVGESLYYLFG